MPKADVATMIHQVNSFRLRPDTAGNPVQGQFLFQMPRVVFLNIMYANLTIIADKIRKPGRRACMNAAAIPGNGAIIQYFSCLRAYFRVDKYDAVLIRTGFLF